MDTKKVLSVQDISCYGQCSNTVLMPMLSAAGLEVPYRFSLLLCSYDNRITPTSMLL